MQVKDDRIRILDTVMSRKPDPELGIGKVFAISGFESIQGPLLHIHDFLTDSYVKRLYNEVKKVDPIIPWIHV